MLLLHYRQEFIDISVSQYNSRFFASHSSPFSIDACVIFCPHFNYSTGGKKYQSNESPQHITQSPICGFHYSPFPNHLYSIIHILLFTFHYSLSIVHFSLLAFHNYIPLFTFYFHILLSHSIIHFPLYTFHCSHSFVHIPLLQAIVQNIIQTIEMMACGKTGPRYMPN